MWTFAEFAARILFIAGALYLAWLTIAVIATNHQDSRRDQP